MNQLTLFDVEEYARCEDIRMGEDQMWRKRVAQGHTCLRCRHRQRWMMGGVVVQYCGARPSRRTLNGLKRIKCKDEACDQWEDDVHQRTGPDVYHYSEEERAVIERQHRRQTDEELAETLMRTRQGIRGKRRRMRLKKR